LFSPSCSRRLLRPSHALVLVVFFAPRTRSLVPQQGPNYFFAKRLQHWRALVAKADGILVADGGASGGASGRRFAVAVSSNVAPASTTRSVVKNPLLALAFRGAKAVPPLHIFDPGTSNVLMTFLLLHDLRAQSRAPSNAPSTEEEFAALHAAPRPPPPLDDPGHPLMLFAATAVHNGTWRCAYMLRSVLEAAVLVQAARDKAPLAAATAAAAAAAALAASSSGLQARL